jgi:zinc protease
VKPTTAFALAEKIYSPWKRGDDPFIRVPVPAIAPLTGNAGVIVEENVNALTVMLQWQGPSVRKDEAATFVADVYSDVLNNDQSRFQRKLVDTGLWQSVVVNYYTLNNIGPITVSGQTTPEKFREAMSALYSELNQSVKPGYFTQDELDATKANRAVSTAFGLERSSESSHTIGFWWSVSGLDYYMKYNDEMAKRTASDLRDYANKYIIGRPHIVGVMMTAADRRRLKLTEAELSSLGIVP